MGGLRKHNPFINSARGGQVLSALQRPWFMLRPPRGYGVLMTTGRASGKPRHRCVRAVQRDDRVYLVAIKGMRTGWLRNALAKSDVRLCIRTGRITGTARELHGESERREAREAYCEMLGPFEYLECLMWLRGRPSRSRIRELHASWFEQGVPLVIEVER